MVVEKKKTPLRSAPKRNLEEDLDRFAAAAGSGRAVDTKTLPWNEPHVREDVMKNLPLRLPEPLYMKLKFIAAHTPYSMNSFITEVITEEIEKEIGRLTKN